MTMNYKNEIARHVSEGKSVNYMCELYDLTRTEVGNILIEIISDLNSKNCETDNSCEDVSVNEKIITIKPSNIRTLEEVLRDLGIDTNEWTVQDVTHNEWQGQRPKDLGVITLRQIKIRIKRNVLISEIEIPKPVEIKLSNRTSKIQKPVRSNIKTALILPDMQVGFKRDLVTGKLTTMHDRAALDVALQIAKYVKPDRIVLLGDNLDLPQESRFPSGPEFYFTTQASAVELSWWLSQFRNLDYDMEIDYLAGNHEQRLEKVLMQNAISAYGLKSADDLHGAPMMSIEKLLGLESLGVRYHRSYPAGKVVLNENLICIHGEVAKGESGATVSSVVKDTRVSVIQGHIHRYEVATKTLWSADDKAHMYTAASFGCLCKIDPGAVPGFKAHQNWQQGVGVVYYEESGLQQFRQEFIPIINGRSILQYEAFEASEESEIVSLIESDTGFKVS